jgi:hypothetical protein
MNLETMTTERISLLKAELAALKEDRKAHDLAKKKERTWRDASKHTPDSGTHRAIVWSGNELKLAWFSDGNWYSYDGTWLLKTKNILADVSHWMPTDWMTSSWFPMHGPGLRNRVSYLYQTLTGKLSDIAGDLRPKGARRNAQLSKKVCYWRDTDTGKLKMGLPENYPVPDHHEKIVCGTTHEAEFMSDRMRRQERSEDQRYAETRGAKEEAIKSQIRGNIHHQMANARNPMNREFLRRYMEKYGDGPNDPTAAQRESFLHNEGYEQGH